MPRDQERILLTITLPDRSVTADFATKSLRKAIAAVREYGVYGCAAIIQGRLVDDRITDAGLLVQQKVPKPRAA